MQRVLGQMRKAIQEFDLIQNGDRIAVGVSGGKDSVILLNGLARLRRFIGIEYELTAITIDPKFGGMDGDYSEIQALCDHLDVRYVIKPTDIGQIVFDIRNESNPCSLCARMRRGALHDAVVDAGCNKLALGHHYDDVVETFVMNLFNEGRLGCFAPKCYLSRKEISMIRPLVFCEEKDIKRAIKQTELPIVKSKCPVDGKTNRETTKDFIRQMDKQNDGFKMRLFGALRRSGLDGWGFADKDETDSKSS